jgi:hypothetical protein
VKALTIIQPFAWLIAVGAKRVENRTWPAPPRFHGPLLIHAGKADELGVSPELLALPALPGRAGATLGDQLSIARMSGELVRGAIVAVAERVVSCQGTECPRCDGDGWVATHTLSGPERDGCPVACNGKPDPFAFGPYCWWLEGVRELARPVPCRGYQLLWTPGPETLRLVREQLQ